MRSRIALPIVAALAMGTAGAQQPPEPPAASCATLERCLAEIRDPAAPVMRGDEMYRRITDFGAAAVDALVPMLAAPDPEIRTRAGYLLSSFTEIDPHHLGALIAAHRAGNRWLPRAIAATGSDRALQFLQQALIEDPRLQSNAQVHFALARFGDRVRPFVVAELGRCRTSGNAELCNGLVDLLEEFPAIPQWALAELAALARTSSASPEVRAGAEIVLIRLRHPAGLEAALRDLEEARSFLSGTARGPVHPQLESPGLRDMRIALAIRDVGRFAAEARNSVPLLLWFLGRADVPDARAAAALALGSVGDGAAGRSLVALEQAFADDWLLAYNAVESLGRLRLAEARPLLERTSRTHWYRPVRNNAERALNALRGGAFERSGVPRDGAPFEQSDDEDETILYFGDLRYRGDRDLPSWCDAEAGASVALQQIPLGGLHFPPSGTRFLSFRHGDPGEARSLTAARPELARGDVTAVVPTRDGMLIGHARGDEGALFHFDEQGRRRELVRDRVGFGFRLGGRLYFVTGSVHAMSTWGSVWEIDADAARIIRRIRLPAHAYRASVASARAVILETGEGAVAIREDGSLADPGALVGPCTPDR